jgi:hypothetical protein
MYGAINAPTTGNKTFTQFAANVQTTNEPGLDGITPPSASSNPGYSTAVANTSPAGAGTPTPINSGAAAPTQSTGAAGSVTAGPAIVLGLASLVAGLVL